MLFIEKLVEYKRVREQKLHWGSKVMKHRQQLNVFPAAETYFIFLQRDGRDIAASQKHVGEFNHTVEEIAEAWSKQMSGFLSFCSRQDVNALLVRYESLAENPEPVLREITDFIGVSWSDRMLRSHELDLSIHRNPASHLSANQIRQAINTRSIGRYKNDLAPEEIQAFQRIAGATLDKLGYSV